MSIFSPQYNDYKRINLMNIVKDVLFYIGIILSIVLQIIQSDFKYIDLISFFNYLIIITYLFLEIIIEYFLIPIAESKRQNSLIDNSFGSKLLEKESVAYFDNDELKFGTYKLCVNLFENCFYSYKLTKLLRMKHYLKIIFISILMIVISCYGFNNFKLSQTILQFLFSVNILGNSIKGLILNFRLFSLLEEFNGVFRELNGEISKSKIYLIFKLLIQYEALIAKIPANIPDKLFEQQNDAILEEWKELKYKYKINEYESK